MKTAIFKHWHRQRVLLLALTSAMFIAQPAIAEKADRTKPVDITFAKSTGAFGASEAELIGDVVLTQGTLKIEAARMTYKKDNDDFVVAQLFSTPERQITFTEKREGSNDTINGVADSAEYDQRNNTIKLFKNARIKSGTEVVTGEFMLYNTVSERYEVADRTPGSAKANDAPKRSTITFQPRVNAANTTTEASAAAPASAAASPPSPAAYKTIKAPEKK